MNTKQETREATQQISQQNQSMKLNQLHCIEAAINQIASVTRTTPGHIIVNLTPICWSPEQAEQIREFMMDALEDPSPDEKQEGGAE